MWLSMLAVLRLYAFAGILEVKILHYHMIIKFLFCSILNGMLTFFGFILFLICFITLIT